MRTDILGVGVDTYTYSETVEICKNYLKQDNGPKFIVTPNPEIIMRAVSDGGYKKIIESADLVLCDGVGVYLAAKLNKNKIPERVRGCDLCFTLFDEIKGGPHSAYLLGAAPGVALKAKENMEARYKGLDICGTHDGYFKDKDEDDIVSEINRLKPDILLVGLGFPKQEEWIHRNRHRLNVKLVMAVGGSIDVMAGEVKRAPVIFQKIGMEWFYRLISQPSRFFRMLVLPKFAVKVIIGKMKGQG